MNFFNKNKELVDKVEYTLNSLTDCSDEIFTSVRFYLIVLYNGFSNY
jgi:hypothetical protein